MSITPVTDRTAADVANRAAKGFYNTTDLNRVESNTQALAAVLGGYGYHADLLHKLDWALPDIPTQDDMERYLGNVRALVEGYYVLSTTPPLPASMDNLDWRVANAIEQNQADMHANIGRMVAGYRKLGTFRLGQGGNLPT